MSVTHMSALCVLVLCEWMLHREDAADSLTLNVHMGLLVQWRELVKGLSMDFIFLSLFTFSVIFKIMYLSRHFDD